MKRRDQNLYGSASELSRLAEEYRWIGRATKRPDSEHLVVLSINPADLDPNKNRARYS